MAKSSGTTRASTKTSPRGLEASGNIDLSDVYKSSGMLDMDYSKAPKLKNSDFTEENEYYYMTKPMELDVNIKKTEDFWNDGLTGGESGAKLREAKQAVVDTIKKYSKEELSTRDVEWDKDLNEFVAWHRPKRPGDVEKSYWKIDNIKQTVRFRREKRSGYLSAADKYGDDLYSSRAVHNYTIKVKNTGTKEY